MLQGGEREEKEKENEFIQKTERWRS